MGNNCTKSTEITCPSDYDQESFNKILRLFDRLDTTGDLAIDTNEMNNHEVDIIAEHYNIEKMTNLTIKKDHQKTIYEQKIENIQREAEEKLKADLRNTYDVNQLCIDTINDEIVELEKMTNEEKRNSLKKTISGHKTNIGFWDFFKYMKDRINKFTF